MKPSMKLILAIGFPILLMAGWVAKVVVERNRATEVEFAIEGYDPRDLLSGHYLTYSVNFQSPDLCKGSYGEEICLCLEAPEGQLAKATQSMECANVSCPLYLKGSCRYGRFTSGIERFYFSETHTKRLAVVPPKATIKVRITSQGTGFVRELRIDGKPLAEWLRAQP